MSVKVWNIGEEGEYYAADSEEEVRAMYVEMVGKEQAEEDFASESFRKLSDQEIDARFLDPETGRETSLREVAESSLTPVQICSQY